MNKILAPLLIILSITTHLFAQNERFIYSDTFITSGVSPISAEKIKANRIRRMEMYNSNGKDSAHYKTFLYDTSGNLIKEILLSRNKSFIGFVDSIVYDSNNHRKKQFSKTPLQGTISESIYEYFGDSLIHYTFYNIINDKIDTLFGVAYLNEKKQFIKYSTTDGMGNKSFETKYTYSDNGLIKSRIYTNFKNTPYSYRYTYEHRFSKNGRRMIIYDNNPSGKKINTECIYNKNNECIECTSYYTQPDTHTFEYKNGLLYEHIKKYYNQYSRSWLTQTSRYYYYQ